MATTADDLFALAQQQSQTPPTVRQTSGRLTAPRPLLPATVGTVKLQKSNVVNMDDVDNSLLENIKGGVSGILSGIKGIPQFGVKAAQTGVGFVEGGLGLLDNAQAALGGRDLMTTRQEADYAEGVKLGLTGTDLIAYSGRRQFPLAVEMAQSYARTGQRLADVATLGLAPIGESGIDYYNLYTRGELGGAIVEDLGNAILAGRMAGLGNVVVRGGAKLAASGRPRLGAVISATGRFVEEPIGETVRQGAKLGLVGARRPGSTLGKIADPLLRVASSDRPLRQIVNERIAGSRAFYGKQWLEIQTEINAKVLLRDSGVPPEELARLQTEILDLKNKQDEYLAKTGLTKDVRRSIKEQQTVLEATRTNMQAEAVRLNQYGPSAVFPDADAGPLPDFAGPVANLIITKRLDIVVRETAAGKTPEQISRLLNPPAIGPALADIGYEFTPQHVIKALDYVNNNLNKFDRQSIDAAHKFLGTIGKYMTEGQLSGEYRLGGPMPESYTRSYPLVEFLFANMERDGATKQQAQMLGQLDIVAAKYLDDRPAEAKPGLNKTSEKPQGAFKDLAEVPADHPLFGVAQLIFEKLYDTLLRQFPETMRDPSIYPATTRPAMMAEARILREARASDVATMINSLNKIADQFEGLLGKKLIESIRSKLEKLGTAEVYNKSLFTGLQSQIARLIASVTAKIDKLNAESARLSEDRVTNLAELERVKQELLAVEQKVQDIFTNTEMPPYTVLDIATAEAELAPLNDAVDVAQRAVDDFVEERRRQEATLDSTIDPRQQIIDDIDGAVRVVEGADDVGLQQLVDEFEFRRREMDAGRPDPTESVYDPRDPQVKIYKADLIENVENRILNAQRLVDQSTSKGKVDYDYYKNGRSRLVSVKDGEAYEITLENYVSKYPLRNEIMDYFYKNYVDRPSKTKKLMLGPAKGYVGEDYAVEQDVGLFNQNDSSMMSRVDPLEQMAASLNDLLVAKKNLKTLKQTTLATFAQQLSEETVAGSGYDMATLARIVAYATNPQLLLRELQLRDRYAADMTAGRPYIADGDPVIQARLISVPAELAEKLRKAQQNLREQSVGVARLRTEGSKQQQANVRSQLVGVGKIITEGEPPVQRAAVLKGITDKAANKIEQAQNKDLNILNKLNEVAREQSQQDALLTETMLADNRTQATARQLDQPVGPQLFAPGEAPGYLPTGLPRDALETVSVATEMRSEGAAPQIKSPLETQRTTDVMALSITDVINRLNEILNVIGRNKIIENILRDKDFTKTANELISKEFIDDATTRATDEVLAQTNTQRTPGEIQIEIQKGISREMFKELQRQGYEPVSRVEVDPETGSHEAVGDLLSAVDENSVDVNTFVMKRGFREQITQEFVVKDKSNVSSRFDNILESLDKFTAGWKSYILPISARWQIGDAVGLVLFAWQRGDIPPGQFLATLRDVTQRLAQQGKRTDVLAGAIQDPLISTLVGAGLSAKGLRTVDFAKLRGLRPGAAVPEYALSGPLKGFRNRSFRFNEYMNTVGRSAVAMIKLDELLQAKGRKINEVSATSYIDDPQIRDAVNQAVRETNDALGAFSEMSPYERRFLRRLFPFWSWLRFINKAALEMAIDNPDRVLFYSHLGSLTAEDDNGLFDFLEGKVQVGGYYIDVGFLNPYGDAMFFSNNPIKSSLEDFTSINPVLAAPLKGLQAVGYYLGNGYQVPGFNVSRPGYLEGRSAASTRTLGDLAGELGYLGLQNFGGPLRNLLPILPNRIPVIAPEGRLLGTDVAIGNVQRFPQGSARTEGRYAEPRLGPVASRLSALVRTFGIPGPLMESDLAKQQSIDQAAADREALNRRLRERRLSR